MKHLMFATAMGLVWALPASADPIFGTWKTIPDDNGDYGHIEVAPCGGAICGTLVQAFNSAGDAVPTDNLGRKIIWDMEAQGDGAYSGGKVWAPDRDRTYNSKLKLSGDVLAVSGCVLGICRDGGTWSRVK